VLTTLVVCAHCFVIQHVFCFFLTKAAILITQMKNYITIIRVSSARCLSYYATTHPSWITKTQQTPFLPVQRPLSQAVRSGVSFSLRMLHLALRK
jgi:hypothetical protein